jgi:RNA polymerase sigma-70 factor (ECF subfamily)
LVDRTPDLLAANQLAEEVQLGLEQLRPEYREAFVLFHEHELSYAEIATSLECPLGTVKTWVHRARKELIRHLQRRAVIQEPAHALRNV